jgi:uncharacterized protein (TIGR03382 family)
MSGCIYGPFVQATNPSVSCEIEVYVRSTDVSFNAPEAHVFRNNVMVDVTGTVEDLGPVDLDMAIYTVDCDGQVVATSHTTEAYTHFSLTLANAQPGELLYVNGGDRGYIQPATSTCPAPEPAPQPSCSGMYDWSMCEGSGSGSGSDTNMPGDDDVGCNAGGASSLVWSVFALALIVRRCVAR